MNGGCFVNNKGALLHPFDQLLEIERRTQGPGVTTLEAVPSARGKGLAVYLGAWKLLFPLEEVSEIAPLTQITPVPAVKAWLMGITNLRGMILSIIDLRNFLTGKSTLLSPKSRLIVIRSGDWGYGLLVDEVIGMRNYNREDLSSKQDEIDPAFGDYCAGFFRDEGHPWLVFSIDNLVSDPRFQRVAKKDL